jgi:glycerophosphoryl diester phosphodiesterase
MQKHVRSFAAILICIMGVQGGAQAANRTKKDFLLIAHRGGVVDGARSENSLKALDEAVRRGYSHVEVDARCTKDGHVVCFHLNNLKSETGMEGSVSDYTLEEVRKIVLTRSQETIPTFDEYCARCEGRINVMVDIKGVDDRWLESYTLEIEQALIKHHLLENTLFIINRFPVFNQEKVVAWFQGRARISWRVSVLRGLLLKPFLPDVRKFNFIFNSPRDWVESDIADFHEMGLKVIASINKDHYKTGDPQAQGEADIRKMLKWGVDGLQIDSCYDPVVFEWLGRGSF